MKNTAIALIVLPVLAGCVPQEEVDRRFPPETSCGSDTLGHLVGQPVTAFDFEALDRPVRILTPGAIYTQDYLPNRLNVYLDNRNVIERLGCG